MATMQPLPSEHRTLTAAELYDMAKRFLRPSTNSLKPSKKRREKSKPQLPVVVASTFKTTKCLPYKMAGPNQMAKMAEPDYVVWNGERERI